LAVHLPVSGSDRRCIGHGRVDVAVVEWSLDRSDGLIDEDVSPIGGFLDDTFLQAPVGKILVFALFLAGFGKVARVVATNVLHALVPAALAFKDSTAEATSTTLRGLAFLVPAAIPNIFEAVLELTPVLAVGILNEGARTGTTFRLVHATMMLGKEVLAVKVIVDLLVWRGAGVVVRVARTYVTAVKTKREVLYRHMPLPLVLGAEGDVASVV